MKQLGVACLVLGGMLAAAPILAQDEDEDAAPSMIEKITVELAPENVPDTGGVAGAKGTFIGEFDSESGDLCYTLEVSGLSDAGEAHIHRGEPGRDGSAKIDLQVTGKNGDLCIAELPKDIVGILNDKTGHYVDVHLKSNRKTVAIRGQLAASKGASGG